MFAGSKYRHAVGKVAKKENCYNDLSLGSPFENTNSLKASKKWIAFKSSNGGGSQIGIVSLFETGKIKKETPSILNNSVVVDFDFSPFNDDLIASGGEDGNVKVWDIENDYRLLSTLNINTSRRIENVLFHPSADNILSASSSSSIRIFDIEKQNEIFTITGHNDVVQSFSWKEDGSSLVSTCKDTVLRIWDPRTNLSTAVSTGNGHKGTKGSRAIWLGNKNTVFTTGFTQTRQREYALYDIRGDLNAPIFRTQLDSSSSLLIPLYDHDTDVMYLVGRGETSVKWVEISGSAPFVTEGTPTNIGSTISGATLIPKRCLTVMEGEISRVITAVNDSIIPVSFTVPRRTYRDFLDDLFPDTKGHVPALSSNEWVSGKSDTVAKVSLNPAKGYLITPESIKKLSNHVGSIKIEEPDSSKSSFSSATKSFLTASENTPSISENNSNRNSGISPNSNLPVSPSNRTSLSTNSNIVRTSSYRFISGVPLHPRENFEDIRSLSYSLSGESNVLETNSKFLAFPINGPGGRLAVKRLDQPGRFPAVIPSIISGSDMFDFSLSRLTPNILATGSDDAKIRLFRIPEQGILEDTSDPEFILSGHSNRINHLKFHPYAENVLLSTSPEQQGIGGQAPTIRLWDLNSQKEAKRLEGFEDSILGTDWSMDGLSLLATSCKDRKIRIFDPRAQKVVQQTLGHEGVRACRLVFASDSHIISVGFGKGSQREMNVYDLKEFSRGPMFSLQIDSSPSVIVPHFDQDSNIMYLAGRGDINILPVEVCLSQAIPLHFLPKSESSGGNIIQGVSFISKKNLDHKNVEIARCYKLNQTNIEPISFKVPRNRKEYFQDDLYPLSRDFEKSTMSSSEWFSSTSDKVPSNSIDLTPKGMTKLSEAPVEPKKEKKYIAPVEKDLTDKDHQNALVNAMLKQAAENEEDGPLKQDLMEGVDSDEWDD